MTKYLFGWPWIYMNLSHYVIPATSSSVKHLQYINSQTTPNQFIVVLVDANGDANYPSFSANFDSMCQVHDGTCLSFSVLKMQFHVFSCMIFWLVVSTPLKNTEKYEFVNCDDFSIPNISGKVIQSCSRKTTNQIFASCLFSNGVGRGEAGGTVACMALAAGKVRPRIATKNILNVRENKWWKP